MSLKFSKIEKPAELVLSQVTIPESSGSIRAQSNVEASTGLIENLQRVLTILKDCKNLFSSERSAETSPSCQANLLICVKAIQVDDNGQKFEKFYTKLRSGRNFNAGIILWLLKSIAGLELMNIASAMTRKEDSDSKKETQLRSAVIVIKCLQESLKFLRNSQNSLPLWSTYSKDESNSIFWKHLTKEVDLSPLFEIKYSQLYSFSEFEYFNVLLISQVELFLSELEALEIPSKNTELTTTDSESSIPPKACDIYLPSQRLVKRLQSTKLSQRLR